MTLSLLSANYVTGIAANQEMVPAFEDFIRRESPSLWNQGSEQNSSLRKSMFMESTPLQLC